MTPPRYHRARVREAAERWTIEQVIAVAPTPARFAGAEARPRLRTGWGSAPIGERCGGAAGDRAASPTTPWSTTPHVAWRCSCPSRSSRASTPWRCWPCGCAARSRRRRRRPPWPRGPMGTPAADSGRRRLGGRRRPPTTAAGPGAGPDEPPLVDDGERDRARDERIARLRHGLVELDRWLDDRVRTGLADPALARLRHVGRARRPPRRCPGRRAGQPRPPARRRRRRPARLARDRAGRARRPAPAGRGRPAAARPARHRWPTPSPLRAGGRFARPTCWPACPRPTPGSSPAAATRARTASRCAARGCAAETRPLGDGAVVRRVPPVARRVAAGRGPPGRRPAPLPGRLAALARRHGARAVRHRRAPRHRQRRRSRRPAPRSGRHSPASRGSIGGRVTVARRADRHRRSVGPRRRTPGASPSCLPHRDSPPPSPPPPGAPCRSPSSGRSTASCR